jgi:hypothetical protein
MGNDHAVLNFESDIIGVALVSERPGQTWGDCDFGREGGR